MTLEHDADDIADAFFHNLTGEEPKKGPPEDEQGAPQEAPEADEGDTSGEGQEGSQEAQEGQEKPPAEDDPEIAWKQGDAEVKVKLSELRASYETREKAQTEVKQFEELRQRAAAETERASAALTKMLERARAKWEPYSKVDFLVLSKEVDAETLQAVRKEAQAALEDVRFLESELDTTVKAGRESQQANAQRAAQAALAELQHPERGIKGFDQALYNRIVAHAVETGASEQVARSIIDPWAIKAMHKAMLYDESLKKAKAQTSKVVNKPTKLITQPGTTSTGKESDNARGRTLQTLRKEKSLDAAAAAFLAGFGDSDD